jgi:ABC-type lipoprotein release transport system permease subunit
MTNLFKMAYRNLGRNRRRSILSALALSMGLALLMFVAAFFKGEMRGSMESTLRLDSGHLQVRDADYNPDKISVAWEYLVENPEQVAAQIEALDQVQDATPRLVASGIVSMRDESSGVQIMGIDPASEANAIYRQGLIAGEFLTADDREGILIGSPLAENLGLNVGSQINLLVNTSDGSVDEQLFTVRGIFSTGSTNYDKGIVFLPLAKAQSFSGAGDHASFIFVLLHDREQADAVAAAIRGPNNIQVKTWSELNELLVLIDQFSNAYIMFINLIILGVTATVIVNTLVMSVFERTREIGILTAIGMKGRQITACSWQKPACWPQAGLGSAC